MVQHRGRLARWAVAIAGAVIVLFSTEAAYADDATAGAVGPPVGGLPVVTQDARAERLPANADPSEPLPTVAPFTTPLPIPVPNPSGAPFATPPPPIDPKDWSFQRSWLGSLVDTFVTTKIIKVFEGFMDSSVQAGQALFLSVAGLSFVIAAGRWGRSRMPLEELVAAIYERIVQLTIVYMLIGATFRAPGGGPGWFFMIFNGIIGMAGMAAHVDLSGLVTTVDNIQLNISPGAILDIFWNISGYLLQATTNGQNVLTVFTGLLNGATLLWFGTFLFVLASVCFLLFTGGYIAFRFLMQLVKTYLIGCQAYLQGLLGHEMTSSMGSGIMNAAFNLGIETGVFVILVGLFKPIVENFASAMGLASVIGLGGVLPGPVGEAFVTADGAVRITAVLGLDLLVGLWVYALRTIPEQAAAAISGKVDVRPKENAQSTVGNMTGAKIAGAAVGGAASVAAGSAMGAVGAAQMGAGSASSAAGAAAKGALGGYLFGGPAGAVGGAIKGVSAFNSKAEGTIAGGGGGASGGGGEAGGGSGFPFFGNKGFAGGKGGAKGKSGGEGAADAQDGSAAEAGVGADSKHGGKNANQSSDATKVNRDSPRAEASGGSGAADAPGAEAPEVAAPRRPGATVREEADPIRVASADTVVSDDGSSAAASGASGGGGSDSPGNLGGSKKGSGGDREGSQGSGDSSDLAAALRENTAALRSFASTGSGSGGGGGGGAAGGGGGGSSSSVGGGGGAAGGGGESPAGSYPKDMMMYQALTRFAQRKPRPDIPQSDGPNASVNVGSLLSRS